MRLLLLLLLAACSDPPDDVGDTGVLDTGAVDTGAVDTGTDTVDAGTADSGSEASLDAGSEAPVFTATAACGLGPIARPADTSEPCTGDPGPYCPTPAPANARSLAIVATCAFPGAAGDCDPIPVPSCPGAALLDFSLINPNPGAPFGCWGIVHVAPETMASGEVVVHLNAIANRNSDCMTLDEVDYDATISGPCCGEAIDIYFPHGDFTFRVGIGVDWAP